MEKESATRRVVIVNPQGLHARPAHALVTVASRFASDIQLIRDGEVADAKSILSLLTLAAESGAELTIRANGTDAREAVDALESLIANGFGEMGDGVETEQSETSEPSS